MSKLYILAERLVDITTKNRVLDAMLSKSREKQDDRLCRYPNIDTVLIIYERTPSKSPARRLLVDFYCGFACNNKDWMGSFSSGSPKGFPLRSHYRDDKAQATPKQTPH